MTDRAALSAAERAELDRASSEYRSLMRAAGWATTTLWTLAIFGGLSILWGLVSGGGGVLVGAALLAVAWNERRGRDRLRRLDPEGARILGWNQILLAAVVTAYLAFAIARAWGAPSPEVQELEEMAGLDPELVARLTTVVYGAALVIVDIVQAFMARYHFRRQPRVAAFRRDTPDWILELLAKLG